MQPLLYFLVEILILGAIFYIIWWAISQIPVPAPFAWIIRLVFVLIVAVVCIDLLLNLLPAGGPGPGLRLFPRN
jgi:hypothetical protein